MRDKCNRTEENNIVGRTDCISEHLKCLCINTKSMRSYLAELDVPKQEQNYESTRIGTWWEYSHGWKTYQLIQPGKGREEGAAEWQNVKRSIEKHLDNNEGKVKVLSWQVSAIKPRGSSGKHLCEKLAESPKVQGFTVRSLKAPGISWERGEQAVQKFSKEEVWWFFDAENCASNQKGSRSESQHSL